MGYIGVNSYPRQLDVAPELRRTLEANGMQAHIGRTERGTYQLITMSHDNKIPHYYDLTDRQLADLVNQGTNNLNKKAYTTFVNLVKKDYHVPESWVAAKNVNSPVNMGLFGYTLSPGEYGIGSPYRFRPFHGSCFGPFDGCFHGVNLRRVGGSLFYDDRRYIVGERPDGRMVAGELKSGSYGFYSKPEQKNDVLSNIKVAEKKAKPFAMTDEEKKKVTCLKNITWYQNGLGWATGDTINSMLSTHGLELNEKDKTLTVKAKGSTKAFVYHLSDDDAKILFNQKIKVETKKGKIINEKDGNSLDERLHCINNIIKEDFDDKVTAAKLNERDYISLKLNEKNHQQQLAEQQPQQAMSAGNDIIDFTASREAYRTGFIDHWNSIGVVDGRQLDETKGFYLPTKGGRAVSVGEIQVYPSSDGVDRGQTYKMTAVINEKVFTHDISKEDYMKFLNYDDEHRLELFDRTFKEVQIKSSKNGPLTDPFRSDRLDNSQTATKLEGDYCFVVGKEATTITSATAWKDEISGNYTLNVRDGKDAGMWSFKITEAQYLAFKNAGSSEKAQMLATLIPWNEQFKGNVRVVATQDLHRPLGTLQANGTQKEIRPEVLEELKAKGIGYEPKEFAAPKNTQEAVVQGGNKPNQIGKAQEQKGQTVPPSANDYQVNINGENLNLNDIRAQTRKNLLGDAQVNGESLDNIKESKEWRRSGENGRSTEIGDITVEKLRDADGKPIEGKYVMSAVIDGNVVSHEINQKQYDKFLVVNDYQRMKLFDKIFPEVEMKTKEGRGLNLGAAILAAVTVGVGAAAMMSRRDHSGPDIYMDVYSKPGVVSPGAVASALYEDKLQRDMENGMSHGMGRGF